MEVPWLLFKLFIQTDAVLVFIVLAAGLQKLPPRAQKFGLVIRVYVSVKHVEKLGA